jgi:hypothetical protein
VAQDFGDSEVPGFAEADTRSKPDISSDFAIYRYGRRRDRAFEILC